MASKEYEMAIKIAGEIEKSFYNSTKLTQKELRNIAKTASQASNSVSKNFKQGMQETAGTFKSLEKAAKISFAAIATAGIAATTASVKVGAEFEAQMSTVQAISNATTEELEKLKEKAKQMGADTVFSATEAGEAMEYMAMAGWKANDMVSGIDGIMDLAAASGEELASTSDIVTDALTAFKMSAADATHFSDVLAATVTNANTNVSLMGETFKYVAPLAGSLRYTVEDTSLAIGLMASSSIKGSQAGTSLRAWLTRMAKPTKESGQAMDDLGISLTDTSGKMKTFSSLIFDTRESFKQLTETEKTQYAAMLAGQQGMSGLLAIVNASDSDVQKLYNSIQNCNGAASKMADIRLNNLKGDFEALSGEVETLGLKVYEQLSGTLRKGVQLTEDEIVGLSNSFPTICRNIKEFGDSMSYLYDPIIDFGEWLFKHPDIIVSTIIGIGTSLATYKVADGIMKLANSFSALSTASVTILAISGAITAITGIVSYISLANREMKKQNLEKHFGNITLSLEELNKAAEHITKTNNLESIQESLSAFQKCDEISNSISDIVDSLNNSNWKVSIGMELTDNEKDEYKNGIISYISDVQELVTQKQYAVNLSTSVLIGDDGIEDSNVIDKINSFYSDKQNELEQLGKKLNTTVTNAFKDGLLDMDEVKEITELQSQMSKIQSAIAGSKFDSQLELLNLKYSGGTLDAETFQNLQSEINEQVQAAVSDYDESLMLSISNAKVMLDDGAIDLAEYNDMVNELKKGYLEQIGEIELKASNFQVDTIKQQYSEELTKIMPEFESTVNEAIRDASDYINSGMDNMALNWDTLQDTIVNFNGVDATTKAALQELFNALQPSIEQLQALEAKYEEYGMTVPESINAGLNNAATLGAISADTKSIWTYVATAISGSPEYTTAIAKAQEAGLYIPGVVGKAIESNKSVISTNINSLHAYIGSKLDAAFRAGYNVNTSVNLLTQPTVSNTPVGPKLPGHATGGIFNTPHVAWFAEDGPEAAIPLDGSQNAINLWQTTGELLGLTGNAETEDFHSLSNRMDSATEISNQSAEISFTNSPTIIIQGNANKEDVQDAIYTSQDNFEKQMNNWLKQNGRLMFGR